MNKSRALAFLFLLSGIEAAGAAGYLLTLPADPKNAFFLGFSLLRLTLILSFLLVCVGCLALAYFWEKKKAFLFSFQEQLQQPARQIKLSSVLFFICVLCLIFLLTDQNVFGGYKSLAVRITPIIVWLSLLALQFLAVLLFFLGGINVIPIRNFTVSLAVFVFPFLVFFPYIIPIGGHFLGIGNDFIPFYFDYKIYLLDHLSRFSFPLWSPSEAAGYPFYANPLTQSFYPFNVILALIYRLTGGYTSLEYQRFTILAISIFALGLFRWLKLLKIGVNMRAVAFATIVLGVCCYRMADLIRTVNALHTAAWYPWILYAITGILLSQRPRESVKYAITLLLAGVFLLTAGYPYNVYYLVFLVVPYGFVFIISPLRKELISDLPVQRWAMLLCLIALLACLVICAPYLLKVAALLNQTTSRSGGDLDFATGYIFSFTDTLGSLIYPPASMADGWYYFGIFGILLIILFFTTRQKSNTAPLHNLWGKKLHRFASISPSRALVKIFFLLWVTTISYISYGSSSLLFTLLWKHLPLFSYMRIIARINIVLVPVFAWVLALAYDQFETLLGGKREERKNPLVVLLVSLFVILSAQIYLILNNRFDEYWLIFRQRADFLIANISSVYSLSLPDSQNVIRVLEKWPVIFAVLSACIIAILLLKTSRASRPRMLLTLALILTLMDTVTIGPWFWAGNPVVRETRRNLNVPQLNILSFQSNRIDTGGRISHTEQFNVSQDKYWYYNRYNDFIDRTKNDLEARRRLLGVTNPQKIFFTSHIDYPHIKDFLEDADQFSGSITVEAYNGDRLVLHIMTPADGYCSFIDNWDSDWFASVDDEPAQIHLLFGTFKSVFVTKGEHTIVYTYRPQLNIFDSIKNFVTK
ncbi:MAG: hypothetical protein HPY45_04125 [Anaerolineae bacterium]|nr:hypothetical protein [Anaerolineae bacterium]